MDMRTTPNVDHYYTELLDLVELVAFGDSIHCLFIDAEPGIGKSYQISQKLKGVDGTVQKVAGKLTPVQLVSRLYDTRGSKDVLFLDDVTGIWADSGLEVLKAATWTEDEDVGRVVDWGSSTHVLKDIPLPFRYRGSVIMCFNEVPDGAHVDALKSRSFYYEMQVPREDKLHIMRELARLPVKGTTVEERLDVADWVCNMLPESAVPNLRMIKKAILLYKEKPSRWQSLAEKVLDVDPKRKQRYEQVVKAQEGAEKYEEAEQAFVDAGYGSASTYARWKRKFDL